MSGGETVRSQIFGKLGPFIGRETGVRCFKVVDLQE